MTVESLMNINYGDVLLSSLPFYYYGMLGQDYRNAWMISYLACGVCGVEAMQNHA